jgi:predicted metal-dependent hydrolase
MPRAREIPEALDLDGHSVPLAVKWNKQARRLTVTVDHTLRQVRLVLPRHVGLDEGLAFCARNGDWIVNNLARLPPPVPFAHGSSLPILGEAHEIVHLPEARRGVWQEPGLLCVSGREEHLARRLGDFLRSLALERVQALVKEKVALVGREARRITLRESRTRWGSCTPSGDLSFCWRLLFAPASVFDYVVAHEVAHLVHLNHSQRFWKLCQRLAGETVVPRRWLVRHGQTLWRYG